MLPSRFNTIIFDIGDVLFTWSSSTTTSISPKVLRRILASPTWEDYERGRLSEDACYDLVGVEFSIDPSEVRRAFDQARDSLRSDEEMTALIRELKAQDNRLQVYAMSNISSADYNVLQTKPADWWLFDRIFTSGAAGERKPNLGFYRHVLEETNANPYSTIFVDDKPENVLSARSLGLHGIVFHDKAKVKRALRNLLGDPIVRGRQYLSNNAGKLYSVTDGGVELRENFAQLLILESTSNRSLVDLVEHPRRWNFFQGKGQLTTENFPDDMDTTSLGCTIMQRDKSLVSGILDEILEYVDSYGVVQTYFDHNRPRFDPVVCVNILSLFYSHGRGGDLADTLQWVYGVLMNRAYLDGTRYYATAECFLFFLTRLLQKTGDTDLHSRLRPLLKERVAERIGVQGDALALAMRVLVCDYVGVRNEVDFRALLDLQCDDGGWEIGWMYTYGSSGIKIGNRGLSTALAIQAIEAMHALPPSPSPTIAASETVEKKEVNRKHFSLRKTRHQRSASFRKSLSWLVGVGRMPAVIHV
ncbi:Haloacid dehalogenase-like hydrolase-domain-containing protein [Mucidula mucida]|nr:Haloacid dehalogenase-like hydrolase-domain-containing protein [Mucidula mucida]